MSIFNRKLVIKFKRICLQILDCSAQACQYLTGKEMDVERIPRLKICAIAKIAGRGMLIHAVMKRHGSRGDRTTTSGNGRNSDWSGRCGPSEIRPATRLDTTHPGRPINSADNSILQIAEIVHLEAALHEMAGIRVGPPMASCDSLAPPTL